MKVQVNMPNLPRGAVVWNEGLGELINGETTEIPEERFGLVAAAIEAGQLSVEDVDLADQDVLVLGDPDATLYDLPPVEQGSEEA